MIELSLILKDIAMTKALLGNDTELLERYFGKGYETLDAD